MGKVIVFLVMGLLIFGAAAGGSVYLLQMQAKTAEPKESDDEQSPSLGAIEKSQVDVSPEDKDSSTPNASQMPLAVRSRPMSAEEIYRYGVAFRKRQDALNKREQSIGRQESRLKLLMKDLQGEQKELEGLQEQVRKKASDAQALLQAAAEKENKVIREQQEAVKNMKNTPNPAEKSTVNEQDNIKKLAAWFQQIEPETSAEYVKELMNDGNTNTAVQIMSHFEEREASKILAAMKDPKLVVQFLEEFKKFKKPAKFATKKR
jgi:flagellar motility protein MotE (MotC chaperone)